MLSGNMADRFPPTADELLRQYNVFYNLVQDPAVLHPGVLREPGGLPVVGPVGGHRLPWQAGPPLTHVFGDIKP